jgi:hypothetical protein
VANLLGDVRGSHVGYRWFDCEGSVAHFLDFDSA